MCLLFTKHVIDSPHHQPINDGTQNPLPLSCNVGVRAKVVASA